MLNRKLQPSSGSKLPVSSSSVRIKESEMAKALKKFNNDQNIRSNETFRMKKQEAGSYMEVASRKLKTTSASNALALEKIKSGISKNAVTSDACTSVRPKIKVARNVTAEPSVPSSKPFKVKRPSTAPASDATLEFTVGKCDRTLGSSKIPSDVAASFVAVNSVLVNAVKKRCPVSPAAPYTSSKDFITNTLAFSAAKRKAKVAEGIPTKLKTPAVRRASTSQLTQKQADKSVETPVTFLQKFWKVEDTPADTNNKDSENNNVRSNERFDTRRVLSKLACDYKNIDPNMSKHFKSPSYEQLLKTMESLYELNNNKALPKEKISVGSNTEVNSTGSLGEDGVRPVYVKSQFQSYDSEGPGSPVEEVPFVNRQTDLHQMLKVSSNTQTDETRKLTVEVKTQVVSSGTNTPEDPPPPATTAVVVQEMGIDPHITITLEMDIQTEEPEPVKKPSTAEVGFTHEDLRKPGIPMPTSCTDLIKGLEVQLKSAETSTTDILATSTSTGTYMAEIVTKSTSAETLMAEEIVTKSTSAGTLMTEMITKSTLIDAEILRPEAFTTSVGTSATEILPTSTVKTTSTSKLVEPKHFETMVRPEVTTAEVQWVDLEETGDTKGCHEEIEDIVEKRPLGLSVDELIQMKIPQLKQPLERIDTDLEEGSNREAVRILQELLPTMMLDQRRQRMNVQLDPDEFQASTQTDQIQEEEDSEDSQDFVEDPLVGDCLTYDEVFRGIQEYGVKPIDAVCKMFHDLTTEMLFNNEPASDVKDVSVGSSDGSGSETDLGRYSDDVMRYGVGGQVEEVSFDEEIIVGSMLSSAK